MEDINILLRNEGGLLKIEAGSDCAGTQYENKAKQLVIERPPEYTEDSLVLIFRDGGGNTYRVDIGAENTFEIPNSLTKTNSLELQAGFKRGENMLILSDVQRFSLRPSLKTAAKPVEEWIVPERELYDKAICSVEYGGGELQFFNLNRDELHRIAVTLDSEGQPGIPGPQGPKGDPGPQGPKGDPGSDIGSMFTERYTLVYVDALNGDDSNNGTSLADAFKTIAGAVAKYPAGNLLFRLSDNAEHIIDSTVSLINRSVTIASTDSGGRPVIKSGIPGMNLFKITGGAFSLGNTNIYLNDGDVFLAIEGMCNLSMGDYYPVNFYMSGTGNAYVIRVFSVGNGRWTQMGTGGLLISMQNVNLYGQAGKLNFIYADSAAYDRCLVMLRQYGVTKDSSAFWCENSDDGMCQLGYTANYVLNW